MRATLNPVFSSRLVFGSQQPVSSKPITLSLIGPVIPDTVIRLLDQLEAASRQPVNIPVQLSINSPGGRLDSAFQLLDKMAALKASGRVIETRITGITAGSAVLVAAHGSPGHRFIAKDAQVMLTPVLIPGSPFEERNQDLHWKVAQQLAETTGGKRTTVAVAKAMMTDITLTGQEIIDFGLADWVLPG